MEIKFSNVSYIYNDKTPLKKIALTDIDLEIKKGKINGIIGKSGSGKTTLVEMIDALILPTSGKVEIDNYLLERNSKIKTINELRFNVGLVFQFPEEQFFNSTVRKEIAFGMEYFNYKVEQIDKRISDALKMVGLDDSYLDRDPFELSNGEKRKVAIASVLAFNPKVIVLDEPTIGLDGVSKNNLVRLLKMLKNRYHKTIIIVTHDVEFLHKVVDHLFVLYKGEIIMEGNKYDVFKNVNELRSYGIKVPQIIEFSNKVNQIKGIKMGYRDEINDLIKDIYRYAK